MRRIAFTIRTINHVEALATFSLGDRPTWASRPSAMLLKEGYIEG